MKCEVNGVSTYSIYGIKCEDEKPEYPHQSVLKGLSLFIL